MDTSAFTVVVRTPNNKDVNIQLNSSSTIQELKRKIKCDHPGSPEIDQQKLIYNGRMLVDHHKIDTVIKESNTVVHLVYSRNEANISTSATVPEPITPQSEVRHRFQSNVTPETQTSHAYPAHTYGAHPQEYAEWMQQYQQQYNYYMQFYAGQNHPYHAMPQAQPIETTAAVGDNNAQVAPVAAPEAVEVRDAQGRMIVADDNGQDWLDALFALTRFGLMLSIIYFYSSTYRFIVAVILLLGIYLYQAGVFQVNRRRVAQDPIPNANGEQPPRDDNNNNSGESGDDEQTAPQQQNTPPPPSIFSTAFCFIRSFFSSLVPTGPPGVVN